LFKIGIGGSENTLSNIIRAAYYKNREFLEE
jgi:hypothetical protein